MKKKEGNAVKQSWKRHPEKVGKDKEQGQVPGIQVPPRVRHREQQLKTRKKAANPLKGLQRIREETR